MADSIAARTTLNPARFDQPVITLKGLAAASRQLAELKGISASIPNQGMLIDSLMLREAKDSSAIENIVTSHDELFRDSAFPEAAGNLATREVLRYRQALKVGYDRVRQKGLLTNNDILEVQSVLELNNAGYRRLPGTMLKSTSGNIVYTPPQDASEIVRLMTDLEQFINDSSLFPADPLIRMALIHHQFESIHPFYDGNGRTGRIVNVLYLVKEGLLDIPVLYMSEHIVRTKQIYYELLQAVRVRDAWEDWVLYLLSAVEETARDGIRMVTAIQRALFEVKHEVRGRYKNFYSQDLINNLFSHPYTKIQLVQQDLGVTRLTATRYLDALASGGVLRKVKVGRDSFYINVKLVAALTGTPEINISN